MERLDEGDGVADAEPGEAAPSGVESDVETQAETVEDLAVVRELILKAYPEIVPELLAGESVDALLASVPAARDAYERVAACVRDQSPAPVPTGAGRRPAVAVESLSPESKIRLGLGNRL